MVNCWEEEQSYIWGICISGKRDSRDWNFPENQAWQDQRLRPPNIDWSFIFLSIPSVCISLVYFSWMWFSIFNIINNVKESWIADWSWRFYLHYGKVGKRKKKLYLAFLSHWECEGKSIRSYRLAFLTWNKIDLLVLGPTYSSRYSCTANRTWNLISCHIPA